MIFKSYKLWTLVSFNFLQDIDAVVEPLSLCCSRIQNLVSELSSSTWHAKPHFPLIHVARTQKPLNTRVTHPTSHAATTIAPFPLPTLLRHLRTQRTKTQCTGSKPPLGSPNPLRSASYQAGSLTSKPLGRWPRSSSPGPWSGSEARTR